MKLVVTSKSYTPIYEQLFEQISGAVISGELEDGAMLPSIRSIASQLGIGTISVKNAYEMLEKEGFIASRAGKGVFVRKVDGVSNELRRTAFATRKINGAVDECLGAGCSEDDIIMILEEILNQKKSQQKDE